MKAVVFRAVGDIVSPMGALTEVELMSPVIGAYDAFHRREPGWIKVELRPAA